MSLFAYNKTFLRQDFVSNRKNLSYRTEVKVGNEKKAGNLPLLVPVLT